MWAVRDTPLFPLLAMISLRQEPPRSVWTRNMIRPLSRQPLPNSRGKRGVAQTTHIPQNHKNAQKRKNAQGSPPRQKRRFGQKRPNSTRPTFFLDQNPKVGLQIPEKVGRQILTSFKRFINKFRMS